MKDLEELKKYLEEREEELEKRLNELEAGNFRENYIDVLQIMLDFCVWHAIIHLLPKTAGS